MLEWELFFPFLIAGPGIEPGQQSNAMINALDLYPTILSWAGAQSRKEVYGLDLSTFLTTDPTNPQLILDAHGQLRETLIPLLKILW